MNIHENGVATPTSIAAIVSGEQKITESELIALSDFVFTEAQKIGELKINFTPEESRRFWSKVDKSPHPKGCWMWTAGTDEDGYGVYVHRRQKSRAPRIAYLCSKGTIYNGTVVCHSCDNPYCVNPDHLCLGDHEYNMKDKARKGRCNNREGEDHSSAKLTDEQVRQISELAEKGEISQAKIGAMFGVQQSTVFKIKHGLRRKLALGIKKPPQNEAASID